jgi:hypothetical protein
VRAIIFDVETFGRRAFASHASTVGKTDFSHTLKIKFEIGNTIIAPFKILGLIWLNFENLYVARILYVAMMVENNENENFQKDNKIKFATEISLNLQNLEVVQNQTEK